ncbi:MAG: hypothetical protein QXI12_09180 [Candidatus Methanomethyliaceae archaeon]
MKRVFLIVLVISLSTEAVIASKYIFDLTKGPVNFQYILTGAYNPIRITVVGEQGSVQTVMATLAYQSTVSIQSLILDIYQVATIRGLNLDVRQLAGQLLFLAETGQGTFSITMQTTEGRVTVTMDCGDVPGDPREIEIRAGVQASATRGQVVIEDGRPAPSAPELVSQKLGVSLPEAQNLVNQFGSHRVLSAATAALSHNQVSHAPAVAGGAGVLESGPTVTNFGSLGRKEVFDLYLNGTRFKGEIRDSTLFLRLFHPANGAILNGLRVIITMLRENSGSRALVVWDRASFDPGQGWYIYPLMKNGALTPGDYVLYIDVEHFQTIKLPLAVTREGQVIVWVPKYEGALRDSTVYLRLYHPVTLQPIRTMPVELAVLVPSPMPNGSPELLWSTSFAFSEENDAYLCPLAGKDLAPGVYIVAINLGGLHTFTLPVVVTPSGEVLPGWR